MLDPGLLDPERVRPLSRDEYERLVEAGCFSDERIELLRGVLVEMSPQSEPHARITAWFAQQLTLSVNVARFDVRSHSPFAATHDSMPEPDVSVTRRTRSATAPTTALLLIEVSGSSVRKDRTIKTEIYAEAGVPEYWIVDLKREVIEILSEPSTTGYGRVTTVESGVLRPGKLRGVAIRFAAIPWLPREPKPAR